MARLYQQGAQRIEVIVRKEGGVGGAGNREIDTSNASADGNEEEKKKSGVHSERFWKTNISHTLHVARQGIQVGVGLYINNLAYSSGDTSLQQQVQRKVEVVSDATSIAVATLTGGSVGAGGGPLGIAIGAVLGFVSSSISMVSKYGQRQQDYTAKIFKQNNAIEYKRARANINLTTGRLR